MTVSKEDEFRKAGTRYAVPLFISIVRKSSP
nr:MAG TPA: hypothetical protein [Caudoviricetes sp.]